MDAPTLDLTDLLGLAVDEPKTPKALAEPPEEPVMTLELADNVDEPVSAGTLMTRAASDEVLSPPEAP